MLLIAVQLGILLAVYSPGVNETLVAPFRVTILNLKQGAADTDAASAKIYQALTAKGVEVLYHDLDERRKRLQAPGHRLLYMCASEEPRLLLAVA